MNQDVNDGEGLRDWDAHGEPSFNRSLKCFFTSAEYVIGMSVECFPNSDIVKCNLVAYAWIGRFLRPTANLRYRHHLLETRTGCPPTAEMLCSADHSSGRTSLSLDMSGARAGLPLRWKSNPWICHSWGVGNDMLPALGKNSWLYNTGGDTTNVHSNNWSGISHLAKTYGYFRECVCTHQGPGGITLKEQKITML